MAGPQFRKQVDIKQLTDNQVQTTQTDTSEMYSDTLVFTSNEYGFYSTTQEFDNIANNPSNIDTSNDTIKPDDDTQTATYFADYNQGMATGTELTVDINTVENNIDIIAQNDEMGQVDSVNVTNSGTYTIGDGSTEINIIEISTSTEGNFEVDSIQIDSGGTSVSDDMKINVPTGEKWEIKRVDIEIEGSPDEDDPSDGVFTLQHRVTDSENPPTMEFSHAEFTATDAENGLYAQCANEWLTSDNNTKPTTYQPEKFGEAVKDVVLNENDFLSINVYDGYNKAVTYNITVQVRYNKLN